MKELRIGYALIILTLFISSIFISIYVNIFWGIIEMLSTIIIFIISLIHLRLYKDTLEQENHDNLEIIAKNSEK